MVPHAVLVAGLLAFAESQASDVADHQKFLSKYFAPSSKSPAPRTERHGILDGVKGAFGQEVAVFDEDHLTPFDRWMGIEVSRSGDSQGKA
jgi:hypothetical protein